MTHLIRQNEVHEATGKFTAGTTRAERLLAAGHWLLESAPTRPQAKAAWDENGAAWLRPGVLFAAAVIRAGIVHAAVGLDSPEACAPALADVLEGGPLFYNAAGFGPEGSYTMLLPARVAQLPPMPGTVAHPQRALLLVPAPNATERTEGAPWWVSPLDGPGLLCPPDRVAVLAAFGRDVLRHAKGRRDPEPATAALPPRVRSAAGVRASRSRRIGSSVMVETGAGMMPAYTETLPRTPESAHDARRLVRLALDVWGLDTVRGSAELVVSELLTNAVLHARRDSVRVTVTRLGDERISVAVVDLSHKRPEPRPAGSDAESGRGLEIVDALSGGRWGVDPLRWGKRVWAELTAPEDEPGE